MIIEIWGQGGRIFSNLIDDGGEVMEFKSGFGFITKSQCKENGWLIINA